MTDRTGGDVVVDVLARSGVDVVFGIPSVHNLPIYDAIRRDGRIRAIGARHEQGAVGAADGFARTTGRLGVCLTSTGPGAANAMGAQLEACVSSSPVLHLTGQIDSRFLGKHRGFIHEVPDQLAMMATLSKASHRPPSPGAIAATITQAVVEAMTSRRGPVSVEIPIDFQYASPVLEEEPGPICGLARIGSHARGWRGCPRSRDHRGIPAAHRMGRRWGPRRRCGRRGAAACASPGCGTADEPERAWGRSRG